MPLTYSDYIAQGKSGTRRTDLIQAGIPESEQKIYYLDSESQPPLMIQQPFKAIPKELVITNEPMIIDKQVLTGFKALLKIGVDENEK